MNTLRGTAFARFPTALGVNLVAWSDAGLTGVRLADEADAGFERLARRLREAGRIETPPADAPVPVREAVAAMRSLLKGHDEPLHGVLLDASGVAPFEMQVYRETRAILPGCTRSYGEIAKAIAAADSADALHPADAARASMADAARAVGRALGRNPWPLVIPCHRVLAAGGKLGGFSAPGGVITKQRLLAIEAGIRPREGELF